MIPPRRRRTRWRVLSYTFATIHQHLPIFHHRRIISNDTSYLLDVVIAQRTPILKLLAGEDEALLVRGDALLVLDLALHIVDGVGALDLEGDGLARQGLDEDLHRGGGAVVGAGVAVFSWRRKRS